jgi:acetolactate synthase I/II/III large subunit
MKLSDYVIDFLAQRGVTHFFGMSGGAAVHLFDSVARYPNVDYICSQHEQSSAISADGYARVTGKLGVAITTSGPGATNLLTGVCCSYYDSVPTLMITGQVATYRLKGDRDVRQVGFQETDVISIYSTVTKYAYQIKDPATIRYHLEKAYHLAFDGRPGTVLIDLPDDLQRAQVDPDKMRGYLPEMVTTPPTQFSAEIEKLVELLSHASRPVLVLGGGLTTPRIGGVLDQLIDRLQIPVVTTWAATDLIPDNHLLRVGSFGVYGPRLGNFTVQNADLLICLGTRLSQNVTGGILRSFARAAKIVMVDASKGEMDKFDGRGIDVHLRILARLDNFVPQLFRRLDSNRVSDYGKWKAQINHWRVTLPTDRPGPTSDTAGFVDAYDFVDQLSQHIPDGEPIFVDTGGNLTWTCNGLKIKRNQMLLSAWNNTPMGYALPAAIGAVCHTGPNPTTCIIGDGGLMLCLSELATLVKHRMPIRVILFNNHGHGIQKQTLETWLNSNYVGVDPDTGLAFSNFEKIGNAMGLKTFTISKTSEISAVLRDIYSSVGPTFCNVEIKPDQKLYPVLKFGSPLEKQMPEMDQRLIEKEMLIPPFQEKLEQDALGATAGV